MHDYRGYRRKKRISRSASSTPSRRRCKRRDTTRKSPETLQKSGIAPYGVLTRLAKKRPTGQKGKSQDSTHGDLRGSINRKKG